MCFLFWSFLSVLKKDFFQQSGLKCVLALHMKQAYSLEHNISDLKYIFENNPLIGI